MSTFTKKFVGTFVAVALTIGTLASFPALEKGRVSAESDGYTVVKDQGGAFQGIALDDPMDESLYFGIMSAKELSEKGLSIDKTTTTQTYAVTEFKLGTDFIMDYADGGLLLKIGGSDLHGVDMGIYVFRENYGYNRFWSATGGLTEAPTHTLITDDGEVQTGTIAASKTQNRATFPKNTVGTWNLPWANFFVNNQADFEASTSLRVLILYETATSVAYAGEGLRISSIATYGREDDVVTVKKGFVAKNATYTTNATDTTADVNLADISKGTKVYTTKQWVNGIGVNNYTAGTEAVVGVMEYGRYTALPTGTQDGFVGYDVGGEFRFSGEPYLQKANTVLTPVTVNAETVGASVRLVDPVGLRFTFAISTDALASLGEYGVEYSFGTIVIPEDLKGDALTLETENVLVVPSTQFSNEERGEFSAVVAGMTAQTQYDRALTARVYLTLQKNEKTYTVYFDEIVKSIAEVAQQALVAETDENVIAVLQGFVG